MCLPRDLSTNSLYISTPYSDQQTVGPCLIEGCIQYILGIVLVDLKGLKIKERLVLGTAENAVQYTRCNSNLQFGFCTGIRIKQLIQVPIQWHALPAPTLIIL